MATGLAAHASAGKKELATSTTPHGHAAASPNPQQIKISAVSKPSCRCWAPKQATRTCRHDRRRQQHGFIQSPDPIQRHVEDGVAVVPAAVPEAVPATAPVAELSMTFNMLSMAIGSSALMPRTFFQRSLACFFRSSGEVFGDSLSS